MRYESMSHVKFLRPFFALLLAACAGLALPTLAQTRTDCAPFFPTGNPEGRPLDLHLGSTADPNTGQCKPDSTSPPFEPGAVVPACYSGNERTPSGYYLNSLTTCHICAEGEPGCNVYLPPPGPPPPIMIDPSIALPPPIHAFYDPYGPWNPYDPWNPIHPYDPWDPWWPSCIASQDPKLDWVRIPPQN